MNVFVSYTLRDGLLNKRNLQALESALGQASRPYIDILHNVDSQPQRRVEQELERASVVILCRTPGVMDSEWVRFELETAAKRNVPVWSLDVDLYKPTTELQLPNSDIEADGLQAWKLMHRCLARFAPRQRSSRAYKLG